MRIYKLTCLAHTLNSALGSGKFQDITYQEVWEHILDESIFEFLTERLGLGVHLSFLQPVDKLELILDWQYNLGGCIESFWFDGHHNGLCLLVGYLLEGISRRAQDANYRLTLEMCGAAVPGGELNSSFK